MSLSNRINEDIKKAMLAKDKKRLDALRAMKSAVLLINTSGTGEVKEEDIIKTMQKLVKQRRDAGAIYEEQGRSDMAEEEFDQASVIEEYLPKMMTEDEIRDAVQSKIRAMGAKGSQDMGKVMGPIMAELQGRADGRLISALVREALGE